MRERENEGRWERKREGGREGDGLWVERSVHSVLLQNLWRDGEGEG